MIKWLSDVKRRVLNENNFKTFSCGYNCIKGFKLSLVNKMSHFRFICDDLRPQLIGLSQTWLSSDKHFDSKFHLDNDHDYDTRKKLILIDNPIL